jgi:hypothetical protein
VCSRIVLLLATVCLLNALLPVRAEAISARNQCIRKRCTPSKALCVRDFKGRYKAAKGACAAAATSEDRRICRRTERQVFLQKKRACKVAYENSCKPCCAGEVTTSCSVRPAWTTEERAAIEHVVGRAGSLEKLAEDRNVVSDGDEVRQGDFKYVQEKHDVVDNIESVYYLGLNDDVIWPGNLIEGTRAHDFIYQPISVDRAPVTLSISLEGSSTGEGLVQVVENPRLSTMRQGISNLLKKAITDDTRVPAKVEFNYQQVYSKSQMDLFLGVDVSYGAGSLDTRFDWSAASETNKILVKYKQIYYSIDIDTPNSPADFFDATQTVDEISAALPAGSFPLYIASVSYGLMAIMAIETRFSQDQMSLALDAAYSGTVDVQLGFGYTAKEVLQQSSLQIIVYGGSTAGLGEVELGFDGFMAVVGASRDFNNESPGVPLVYKFRHLSDNTLALITLFSQYTLMRPVQIIQRVKVTLDQFVCTKSADGWDDPATSFNTKADVDRLYFGYNAYNRTDTKPDDQINPEPYYDMPGYGACTEVYGYSDPGWGWQPGGGEHKAVGQSFYLDFDTENYKFALARLDLAGYARDYDWTSGSEHSFGNKTIYGEEFLSNGGKHVVLIDGSDVTLEAHVTIELVQPSGGS